MDRWGLLCILMSSIFSVIRAIIRRRTNTVDSRLYRTLTGIAMVLITLGIILYCFM